MDNIVLTDSIGRLLFAALSTVVRAIIIGLLLSAVFTENRGVLYAPIIQVTRTNLLRFVLLGAGFFCQFDELVEANKWQRDNITKRDEG